MESSIKVDQKRLENIVTMMNQFPYEPKNRKAMDLILDSENEEKGNLFLGACPNPLNFAEIRKEHKIDAVLSIMMYPEPLDVPS